MKPKAAPPPGSPPQRPANAGVGTSRIRFCDLRCPRAGFAKESALDGSCRTFASLWCAPPADDRVLSPCRRNGVEGHR